MYARAPAANAQRNEQAAPHWLSLLGVSEAGGRDYAPRIEGALPSGLEGSLYRNGPGLFERGGVRRAHLLDGDGLVQRLSFADGRVRYQNAFVHTAKFEREAEAERMLHPTWTTRRPGGWLRNLGGGDVASQAGVTIYPVHGALIARDETGPSYLIDPETLATKDVIGGGGAAPHKRFKAHSKLDPQTGEWLLVGTDFGRTMSLQEAVYEPQLELRSHQSFAAPRQVYMHDFSQREASSSTSYTLVISSPCHSCSG